MAGQYQGSAGQGPGRCELAGIAKRRVSCCHFPTEVTMQNRRQVTTAGLLLGGGLLAPTLARAAASPQSLAERFAATLSAGDIDGFSELFADTYVNHQKSAAAPPPANITPKQGTVAFFKARLVAMPDLKVAREVVVADKDHVAASFVYSGTHKGAYFGVAPTGRTLRFTSCDIFRVQDDLIVEHWGMGDIAGVLAQLRV
ncbi:ester cyclase [Mesorhizobium loti]|uniref:ester cyclase n=1 Tax=Rhizobium loti TaxID=381 RepID=UPI0009E19DC2|nr:ester cyclase [Mesorhizobium loti]